MQTLVYENYSKIIDATDTIKSIGTNVSNVSGDSQNWSDQLRLGMDRVQFASSRSKKLLRDSRDAVVEKLKIQCLLTRLDALLSLPQTGFESLQSIELECESILRELVSDLREKLLGWSGGGGEQDIGGGSRKSYNCASDVTEQSPTSIAEIFECARTLLTLNPMPFLPGLERSQFQSLALAACGQFLREHLVAGHATFNTSATGEIMSAESSLIFPGNQNVDHAASDLPMTFLDGILESTTLYGVSFEA